MGSLMVLLPVVRMPLILLQGSDRCCCSSLDVIYVMNLFFFLLWFGSLSEDLGFVIYIIKSSDKFYQHLKFLQVKREDLKY